MDPQASESPVPANSPLPLKILMLHGYTRSGSVFYSKTRALQKHLQKSFPLRTVVLSYPNGPLALDPTDIPGFEPASDADQEPQCFAWWRRSDTVEPPEYVGIEKGLATVSRVLSEEGPFDGVIGFSQGAAMAAMLASLLEPSRHSAFDFFSINREEVEVVVGNAAAPSTATQEKAWGIPFPSSFEGLGHPPLKFAVCYSGFRAPGARYRGFYEHPKIQTPILHVLGSLDTIVDEGRSKVLIEACDGDPEKEGKVIRHPGGHIVPSQRLYLDILARFIKDLLEPGGGARDAEEKVEDMDVPF